MADCNRASFIPLLIFFKDHNGLGGGQALCVHPGHHVTPGTLTTTASLVQDLHIIIIMYKEKRFAQLKPNVGQMFTSVCMVFFCKI